MSSRRISNFRYDASGRRAGAGNRPAAGREGGDRRAARAARRGRDRGRLRGRLAGRLRRGAGRRASGEARHRCLAVPRELDGHRRRGGGARGRAALTDPHLPRHQRPPHGEEASPDGPTRSSRTRRPRSPGPARAWTRSSSRARTQRDPIPSSSPPSAVLPSRPARRRSTSRTPSATCCRPSTRTSSGTYAELCPELEQVALSAHCHDDLGLAVANSLAALDAGVQQLECTVNGIGERAGNASLEEIVMAMRVRGDALQAHTDIDLSQIGPASRLVERLTNYPVPPNKAIVGANAFAHEAGIHQDGLLKDVATYQIIDPGELGLAMTLPLGKHSGRHAFSRACEEAGLRPRRGRARRGVRTLQGARRPGRRRLNPRALPGGDGVVTRLFDRLSRGRRDRA